MRIIVKWVMLSVCRRSNERIIIMSECRAFVPNVHVLSSQDDVGDRVARMVLHDAGCAIVARDRFVVAFSGGSLPSIVCPHLLKLQSDFSKWWILFADERCVPDNDPDSNYGLLYKEFLAKAAIPDQHVIKINQDLIKLGPEAVAEDYEHRLRSEICQGEHACIDLILLGLGPDGHTASLFPGHSVLQSDRLVASITDSPKPPPNRITLTLACMRRAHRAIFTVTGKSKQQALSRILKNKELLPPSLIQTQHPVFWFIDSDANPGIC